jgi:hypothetical protein
MMTRQLVGIDEPVEIADAAGPWITVVDRCDCPPSPQFPLGETQWRMRYGEDKTHTLRGMTPGAEPQDIVDALLSEIYWLRHRFKL